MLESLTVRDACAADLPTFARFWISMFEEIGMFAERDFAGGWDEPFVEYFENRIARGEACLSVAVDGERVVATAGALESDGYPAIIHGVKLGYVFGVRVEPEFRRMGLARALTQRSVEFLRARGCKRIRLHASDAGRTIYESLGFRASNEMVLR